MKWPLVPDYGCIDRWPQDGNGFIHPNDLQIAKHCIPGNRVFRRDTFDGVYYHCVYGELKFRVKPCLWRPIPSDGLDIGDWVETTGVCMRRELFVAKIGSMEFVSRKRRIRYGLIRRNVLLPNRYDASDLRLLTDKSKIALRPPMHRISAWKGDDEYDIQSDE